VREAYGDRKEIAKALADFESRGIGRSSTIEKAISNTGIRFEFPHELADQKRTYDDLVAGDPFSLPRELIAKGAISDAIAELKGTDEKLVRLMKEIQRHPLAFRSPIAVAEMMHRILNRRTELRAEIQTFSPTQMPKSHQDISNAAASTAQADKEAAGSQERMAKYQDIITACITLRGIEQATFAQINEEFQSWQFSKSSARYEIIHKLDKIKNSYQEWDRMVNELRNLYQERGVKPDRALEFAPDRAQWQALHDRWEKW
jgi:hypothetical protein